jgi:hypothetical protein
MTSTLIVAMSFALLLAVAALCREVRLRRALQEIVRRLVAYIKRTAHEAHRVDATADAPDNSDDCRV